MFGITTSLAILFTLASVNCLPTHLPTYNSTAEAVAAFKRQAVGQQTFPDSNPNPHQNYLHEQISQVITCDQDAGCSAGESDTQSITVQWSSGIGKAVTEWITAGFSVSESWTTGNNYVCDGAAGDTVCIWYNTAHTAYTVEIDQCSELGCDPIGTGVIRSPNNNNEGGGYYCVVGTCQTQGYSYWEDGCAGGPQGNCGNGQVIQ